MRLRQYYKNSTYKILFILCTVCLPAIAAIAQPVADFSATPLAGCAPLAVSFRDLSTGNPTSWQWDLGNGTLATQQNPTTTYFTPGIYTIVLTVSNATGSNTITRTQYIAVADKPTANFVASDSIGCFPLRVNFTDLSSPGTGTIAALEWDFGDGTIGTGPTPFHIYTATGNYSVTLKVTNSSGCVKVFSKSQYIRVSDGVVVNFSNTAALACHPPEIINFTNLSTGPGTLSYQWLFGDGGNSNALNPSHTYLNGGTYTLTLVTQSSLGCVDTLTRTAALTIRDVQSSITAPDSICANSPASLVNASVPQPANAVWNFGDLTSSSQLNPVKTWSLPGTYTIRLINDYGTCADTVTRPIRVLALPVANFTAANTVTCKAPFTVNFQDQSSPGVQTWAWNFGDGNTSNLRNPTHTYTTEGQFTVSLVVTNAGGCRDSITRTNFIRIIKPAVGFFGAPTEGCIPFTFSPTPNVSAIDGVATYLWDFGDGNTSTLQNPSHLYPVQGSYTIKLFITTNDGCTDSSVITNGVRVGSLPVVDFTATPTTQCAGQNIQFTDLSVPSDRWLWDFGNGANATAQNPIYAYPDTGTYTVSLTAWNNGCSRRITKNNFITALPPVARFSAAYNCNNKKQVAFTDQSVLPQSWQWDFGDGNTSNLRNPTHTYANFGNYTVTLTVTNGSCSNTTSNSVILINAPADFRLVRDTVCVNTQAVVYVVGINPADVSIYNWDMGDGSTYTGSPAGHFYTAPGSYGIKLLLTDIRGCRDSITKPNIIKVWGPVANITAAPQTGCRGVTVNFTDLSTTDGTHPITNWQWTYGDGIIQNSTAPPFRHRYDTAGNFTPKLKITDSYGCFDSVFLSTPLFITSPKALFSSADTLTCAGKTVSFSNASAGINLIYDWNLGNGINTAAANPVTTYAADGDYAVRLIVTDVNGCRDTLLRNNYIRIRTAVADFTVSDSISSCAPFEVTFTNTARNITNLSWNFGDGGTSPLPDPVHYFNTPGIYTVTQYATGPGGCVDSVKKTIRLYPSTATISYSPLAGCAPLPISFQVSTPGPVTYFWDFSDGSTIAGTDSNLVYTYLLPGNFLPKVILEDQTGCLIPVAGTDTIRVTRSLVNFGAGDTLFCNSGLVNFTDSTTGTGIIGGYLWSFGDGGTSVLQNPQHLYTAPGWYSVQLVVNTTNGCSDTLLKNRYIKIATTPVIGIAGDSAACVPASFLLSGILLQADTSRLQWNWDFANGNTAAVQNPGTQSYTTPGTYQARLIATNSSNCADTAYKNLTVYALPLVDAGPDRTVNIGFPVILSTTGSPVTNYLWSPPTGLTCTNCATPTAAPRNTTTYKVRVTDANGCVNTDEVTLIVTCNGANVFIPNTFSPNNDGNNDVFYPRGTGLFQVQRMSIFNRWGEMVFQRTNFMPNDNSAGWNGRVNGKPAISDVYTYVIEIVCNNSEVLPFKGNISLIQ